MAQTRLSSEAPVAAHFRSRPELRIELDPVPSASGTAREALEVFADSLSAKSFADLRVIVTELVTNGVKYGPGGPIELAVGFDRSGRLRGGVDDRGSGGVRMRTPGPLGGGLGLVIVDALSTWGVHPGSSHVWFELDPAEPDALV